MNKALLTNALDTLSIPYDEKTIERFSLYLNEIMFFNPSLKLTGYKDEDEIIIKNFLDSASFYSLFKEKEGSILDVGSGAGFPGLVLSILFPEREIVLLDRMTRRTNFLFSTAKRLALGGVRVINKDIKEVKESFDTITSRAFHPTVDVIDSLLKLLKPRGQMLFYKGKRESIEKEIDALKGYSLNFEIKSVSVPLLNEERNAFIIRRAE